MLLSSIFAFLHFITAFTVIFTVFYERLVFKQQLTNSEARLLQKADSLYGLAAVMVLIVGFLRVFLFEKGKDFYYTNSFFWIKLGLFAVVGLLSIYPSIRFLKWKKLIKAGQGVEMDNYEYSKIKTFLNLEVTGLVLMLMAASLMAKGINFNW